MESHKKGIAFFAILATQVFAISLTSTQPSRTTTAAAVSQTVSITSPNGNIWG